LAAANKANYQRLIDTAIDFGKKKGGDLEAQTEAALDRLVNTSP
jgi:transaldolase